MIAILNRSARDWGILYHRAEKAIKTYSEYPPSEPIQAKA